MPWCERNHTLKLRDNPLPGRIQTFPDQFPVPVAQPAVAAEQEMNRGAGSKRPSGEDGRQGDAGEGGRPPGDLRVVFEVAEDETPYGVLDRYRVPRELTHLVLINGVHADEGARDRPGLRDGDTLAVWPPIAGG